MGADYFISSITAVSQEGNFAVCDLTGTRVGGKKLISHFSIIVNTTQKYHNRIHRSKKCHSSDWFQ